MGVENLENVTELLVGYRFVPTDEELVNNYLKKKVLHEPLPTDHVIKEIEATELYSKHPKRLVNEAISGDEKESYFFIHQHEHQHEHFGKTIRVVGDGIGFWKESEEENPIKENLCASKIYFTYYTATSSKAKKTHWRMEEYKIKQELECCMQSEEWVLARIKEGSWDYNGQKD